MEEKEFILYYLWGGGIGVAIFFFLSGYGCYISVGKSTNKFNWVSKHVAKMLIYFGISFIFVMLISCLMLGNTFDVKEWILSFVMLRLPGTTTWYFKIQLLFYVFLAISEKLKERQVYLITLFVLLYAIIADFSGLSDYWWKTSLCFAAGCAVAKYREVIIPVIEKVSVKIILIVIGCGAIKYTRIDYHYILMPQLIAYVLIAGSLVIAWDWLMGNNKVLEKIGKTSLTMYLVHIGVVDSIFLLNIGINSKIVIFVIITAIGTTVCALISERINRAFLLSVKK